MPTVPTPNGKTFQISLFLGVALFAASFFLPCVPGDSSGPSHLGWECAAEVMQHPNSVLIDVSALINPLVLVYLTLELANRSAKLRTWLAVLILLCIGVTWCWLGNFKVPLGVAHPMWIAGVLLIMAQELARWKLPLK